jgi:PKD repeat protein
MAIKMVMVFMISRIRRASAFAALLLGAVLTVGCQKVPLLAPSGSTITLTASATALPVNGTTDIIAQVIEPSGTPPHSGTLISFTTNLGSVQPSEAETDLSGRVVVKYVAGSGSGTATITAISGGVSASGASAIKIAVGAAAVGGISVSASPQTLPSAGGSSTISATVSDASGNSVSGVPVTFAIDSTTGSSGAGSLAATVVNTDASGRAQTTLTTSRTTTVSAAAGSGAPSGTPPSGGAQTAKVTVTVNTTSSISIGAATPASPTVNQVVSFALTTPTSTTASAISRVTVDWGDGQVTTYSGLPGTISHSYSSAGSYLIQVTGADAFGDQSTSTTSVTVGPRPRPSVVVTAPDTATPGAPTKITLAATPSATSAPIQQIQVDFGDGQAVTLQGNASSVQHVYATAGTYTVTATATDSTGATGSGSTILIVGGTAPTADFTISPEPSRQNLDAGFNASDSVDSVTITSYDWDFGDASGVVTTTSPTVNHKYAAQGTFTARLTIHDSSGRSATKTKSHTVIP